MEPLVDTVDEDRCRASAVSDFDLACRTWKSLMRVGGVPVPQKLADRLVAAGYAVMRARSFAAGAGNENCNLMVLRYSARRPHHLILTKENSP